MPLPSEVTIVERSSEGDCSRRNRRSSGFECMVRGEVLESEPECQGRSLLASASHRDRSSAPGHTEASAILNGVTSSSPILIVCPSLARFSSGKGGSLPKRRRADDLRHRLRLSRTDVWRERRRSIGTIGLSRQTHVKASVTALE